MRFHEICEDVKPQIAAISGHINESTGNESFDSLEYSLQKLDEIGLPQYKNLFQREGLSRSALPYLEHELLERIGISRLGYRIKILQLKRTAKSKWFGWLLVDSLLDFWLVLRGW